MRLLFRVLTYLSPYRGLAAATFACAVLATLVDLAPPWIIKLVIDTVVRPGDVGPLPWLMLALAGVYVARNLLSGARIWFNNRLEQSVIYDLRKSVYDKLQSLSVRYFDQRATGELASRVTSDTNNLERIFIDGVESLLMAGLTLIGITVILFTMHWKLALLAFIPIPFLIFGASRFTRRIHGLYRIIRRESGQLNAVLQDQLSGVREVLAFNREAHASARFDAHNRAYAKEQLRAARVWSVYSPTMVFLGSVGTLLILWFGAREVVAGAMTLGELVAFLSYLALFYVPINQIHSVNHMLQHALASGERVFEVLDAKPDVIDRPGAAALARASGQIRFEAVSFGYRPDVPVLQNLEFTAEPGETIALVGPSGAGKSTVIKLLLRYYDVGSGRILLDGRDIRDVTLASLRDQIGIVPQDPFLFNGTVRENLLFGRLDATRAEVEAAAAAAHAHEFIAAMPEGYDTVIGERGVKLSGGQKQRVAIARALLKDPPIIIFDEATSNVDSETEAKIHDALERLIAGRTTLIIAHRLSTLRAVDRLIVLDHGRLVETGRHDDLLARGGLYAALYEAQAHV
jgi:ATP-binding cassette subfamily B protein/subfamily B ATP-binding cassette protein MsbA